MQASRTTPRLWASVSSVVAQEQWYLLSTAVWELETRLTVSYWLIWVQMRWHCPWAIECPWGKSFPVGLAFFSCKTRGHQVSSLVNSTQMLTSINTNPLQTLPPKKEGRTLPMNCMKLVLLWYQTRQRHHRKENYSPISILNTDTTKYSYKYKSSNASEGVYSMTKWDLSCESKIDSAYESHSM